MFVRREFPLDFVFVLDAIAEAHPQFLFPEYPTKKRLAKVNTKIRSVSAELCTYLTCNSSPSIKCSRYSLCQIYAECFSPPKCCKLLFITCTETVNIAYASSYLEWCPRQK